MTETPHNLLQKITPEYMDPASITNAKQIIPTILISST